MHASLLRRWLLPVTLVIACAGVAPAAQARCVESSSCPAGHTTKKQRRSATSKQHNRHRAVKRRATRVHRVGATEKPRQRQAARRQVVTPRSSGRRTMSTSLSATHGSRPPAVETRPASPVTSSEPTNGATQSRRLFAETSIWNSPLTSGVQLDPTSSDRMQALTAEISREKQAGNGPWINDVHYSTPVYRVSGNQRRVPVTIDNGSWADSLRRALVRGVPIPDDAQPAWGSDGHIIVYQAASDTLWEFWRASKKSDGWHAVWGGVIGSVSENPGYYDNTAVPGLAPDEGWGWAPPRRAFPSLAG